MQVAASSTSEAEWSNAVGQEFVVGDNVWALGNILWRIYAEVRPVPLDTSYPRQLYFLA